MKKSKTILVLDANQRSALAVTRSLGRLSNLRIITADETPSALAGHSRFSQRYFQYPSPFHQPDAFSHWLLDCIGAEHIDWVFPTTEVSSQTVLPLQQQLGDCQIPFATYDTVMTLADKWKLINLAKNCGVPYPASQYFSSSAEVDTAAITRYPVVIKPCLSRIRTASGWLNTSVHIARSDAELHALLENEPYLREHAFMMQEFIPGHGGGIFALYDRGKPITFFAHRRLREKPPTGGVSTLSESVSPNPQMLKMAKSLLDAAQWHGVAMVEFRITPDGTPYLMEVNTRFWGSLQLAIDSGVDFPALLLKISSGEPISPPADYRVGQRLRWLLGDLDSLYLTLRNPAFNQRQKLGRVIDFFTPNFGNTRHEVNRWSDLSPAWFELKSYIQALKD